MRKIILYFFGIAVLFSSCKEDVLKVSKIEGKQLNISTEIAPNSEIETFIEPYKTAIEAEMNTVLAYAPHTLSKTNGQYNSAIGNMMADAVMELGNPIFKKRTGHEIDGVLLNYGGIRSIIPKGNITTRTAYNIMPFENQVAIVELPAAAVDSMFAYLATEQLAHPISGMQLILNPDNSIKSALVQGKPVEKDKTYFIATNDYLRNGGDRMYFFAEGKNVFFIDYKLRNLFIDYFAQKDTIAPEIDQRFIKIEP